MPHPCRCTFGPLDQAVLGELGERLAVLRILDSTGTVLTVVARINTQEMTGHKAYGTMNRLQARERQPSTQAGTSSVT